MPDHPHPLAALLGAGSPHPERRPDRRGIPEAQIERLREVQQRYAQPNPYEPGDVVTPRLDAGMTGERGVFIVLEVVPRAWPAFNVMPYGTDKRFDLRLAYVDREGRILTVWAESFEMEPWSSAPTPVAEAPPRPAAANGVLAEAAA